MPVRDDGQVNQGVVAMWAGKERMSLDDWGQVLLVCDRHTLSVDFRLRAILKGSSTKCNTLHYRRD